MLGINERYFLNPHIEETHRDAKEAVNQLMKAFDAASGDSLYRSIAEEAKRSIKIQFAMKPNELITKVVNDFRKVLSTISVNAFIALTEKVQRYMNLSDTEKIMAATVDQTIYSYVCEHLNDDDVYVEMKKVYDHFIAA